MIEDKNEKHDDLPRKTNVNWHDFECKTLEELVKKIEDIKNADIINIKASIFYRVD